MVNSQNSQCIRIEHSRKDGSWQLKRLGKMLMSIGSIEAQTGQSRVREKIGVIRDQDQALQISWKVSPVESDLAVIKKGWRTAGGFKHQLVHLFQGKVIAES